MLLPPTPAGGAGEKKEERSLIKLLDFGVAKIRQEPGAQGAAAGGVSDGLQTRAGVLMGTPAYMAPEQIRNSSTVDPRADIYAIGVMLFEAITGERPFRASTLADLIGAHLFQSPPRPSELSRKKGLPPRRVRWKKLDQTILKALAKDPEARYPDCASLRRDLDEAWGRPGAFTDPLERPSGPQVQTRRAWLGGLGAALALGGVGVGAGVYLRSRPAAPPPADTSPRARALQRLTTGLRGEVGERRAVLASLDAVRSPALAPLVATALADENPAVWRAAVPVAAALARPGPTTPAATDVAPLLSALSARAGQAVGPAAIEIATARRHLGAREATQVLHAAAASDAVAPEARVRAAVVLCETGELEAGLLRQLLERLSRGGSPVTAAVRQATLVQLLIAGDGPTEKSLTAAARAATEAGHEALMLLARGGRREAADRLHALLASELMPEQRLAALSALAAAGDRRATAALVPLLKSPQPRTRQRAAAALGTLGPAAADAAPALAPLLDDPDRGVALTVAAALVALAPASRPQPLEARQVDGAG